MSPLRSAAGRMVGSRAMFDIRERERERDGERERERERECGGEMERAICFPSLLSQI